MHNTLHARRPHSIGLIEISVIAHTGNLSRIGSLSMLCLKKNRDRMTSTHSLLETMEAILSHFFPDQVGRCPC
jgi:hypothetical protein